jgi:hypothetical protein
MKKEKNPVTSTTLKSVSTNSMNLARALDFAEDWRSKVEEGKWEKGLKLTLKKSDPARVDLSDEFFDKIHDNVMAHVTKTEELKACQSDLSWQSGKKSKKNLSKLY